MDQPKQPRQETMSPPDRMRAILTRQQPDRVLLIPFASGFCAKNVGYPVRALYDDVEKSFWSQLWTQEMFGYDGSPMYGYASYGGWEYGGDIKMPETRWEAAPVVTRVPVETPEDVDALEIEDIESAGAMPMMLEFAKILQQFGMPILVEGGGPFTVAGNISEVDLLCRWLIKKPDTAHALLRKAVQFLNKVIDCFVEKFPDYPIIVFSAEPTSANQIISPKQFEEFALPYLIETHEHFLSKGIHNIFCHICGEHNLNLEHWAKVPFGDPGLLSFGHEVVLDKAIEIFGDKHVILGNVEPRVIQEGTWQEVYELSRQCIEKGKDAPSGYALMPGCETPVMAPPFNVYAMKKAVMDFGFYD